MTLMAETLTRVWPVSCGDSCGDFFGTMLRTAEPALVATARVLEIGCCEFDWLTTACRIWPEMTFTGIDWRTYRGRNRATTVTGDARVHPFVSQSFDWIASISAIEHMGLGHYEHDPIDPDGDSVVLRNCWDWLAPGGWLSFDVPYNPGRYEIVGTSHRIYDEIAIEMRLKQGRPWREQWRGVVQTGDTRTLVADPTPKRGGEDFYYIGFWWQKPGA